MIAVRFRSRHVWGWLGAGLVILSVCPAAVAGPDKLIDPDPLKLVQNETSLTIVPGYAGRLLVAYNNNPTGSTGLGVALSSDYGVNWSATALPMPFDPSGANQMTSAFDPAASADTVGNAFVAHIGWLAGIGGDTGLWVHKYNYGTSSWTGPTLVSYDGAATSDPDSSYRLNDKCHIAVDRTAASPYTDNVYLTWIKDRGLNQPTPASDIYFARSTDNGATWTAQASQPIINDGLTGGSSNLANGPNVAVAPNGTIYIAWLDIDVSQSQTTGTLYLDKSTDGGVSWGSDVAVGTINSCPKWLTTAYGATDARARSYPSMAVSPSNSNTIYMVYAADRTMGDTDEGDIFFIKSTNGGTTWSTPLLVNDNLSGDQFEPWIAVKPDGTIDVAWYDRRRDPLDGAWDVYIAKSVDGGTSFSTNVRLTDTMFVTPVMGWGERWMGEYLGLAVDGTYAYVAFTSGVSDTLGDVYFDKIANSQVPEPATVLLLGIGGTLAAIVRRRSRKGC